MKKLLIKSEFIIQEYKAPIEGVEAQPEKWVKGEEVLFQAPLDLTDYIYHPAIEGVEAVAEVPELKELRVIDQTQGEDSELELWLSGNLAVNKYPEGYVVEYLDISAQVEQDAINYEALYFLASTDWLIVREVETQVPCPEEIKILRAEARLKIVR